jgi:hypothetical protein
MLQVRKCRKMPGALAFLIATNWIEIDDGLIEECSGLTPEEKLYDRGLCRHGAKYGDCEGDCPGGLSAWE